MSILTEKHVPRIVTRLRMYYPQIDRVADSTRDLEVEVTDKDASKANPKNPQSCAISVACHRSFGIDGILVFAGTAYTVKGDLATRYVLPPSVRSEIKIFDRGGKFLPGQYRLKHVPKSQKMGVTKRPNAPVGKYNGSRKPKFSLRHDTQGIRTLLPKV